jgi:hypothetical protein
MPEPEKLGLGRKIALALASGLGSYGAGLQGRGPVDYVTPELDRRTSDRDRSYAMALRGAGQKRDAARFKIGRIERQEDIKADAEAKKQDQAYRAQVAKDQAKADLDIANLKIGADQALANAKQEWDLKLQNARIASDEKIASLRQREAKSDPLAKEDRKDMAPVMQTINALARTAKKSIGEGATSREEIETLIADSIEEATLATPEAREALQAYALRKLGPIFRDLDIEQMNTGLASGSPAPREPGLFDPLRRLAAARAGR